MMGYFQYPVTLAAGFYSFGSVGEVMVAWVGGALVLQGHIGCSDLKPIAVAAVSGAKRYSEDLVYQ